MGICRNGRGLERNFGFPGSKKDYSGKFKTKIRVAIIRKQKTVAKVNNLAQRARYHNNSRKDSATARFLWSMMVSVERPMARPMNWGR